MRSSVIVIGAGACGVMASIIASRGGNRVTLLEKLPTVGAKIKASGGGRCNLTNRLSNEDFINSFGKNGRFVKDALDIFDSNELIKFLDDIGVETNWLDGFRVFPVSKDSQTIINKFQEK